MLYANLDIDISEVERLARQYPRLFEEAAGARMKEAVMLLERGVKDRTPEGAGPVHLHDTIEGDVKTGPHEAVGLVGSPSVYGEAVEYGTVPHFPPVDPLTYWVERKLGISAPESGRVAYLIARAIAKRGTKGAHMFEKAFDALKGEIEHILHRIPDDMSAEVMG